MRAYTSLCRATCSHTFRTLRAYATYSYIAQRWLCRATPQWPCNSNQRDWLCRATPQRPCKSNQRDGFAGQHVAQWPFKNTPKIEAGLTFRQAHSITGGDFHSRPEPGVLGLRCSHGAVLVCNKPVEQILAFLHSTLLDSSELTPSAWGQTTAKRQVVLATARST